MKKLLFSTLFVAGFFYSAMSQQTSPGVTTRTYTEEDMKKKVVKDSAGVIVPYEQWTKLTHSGLYTFTSGSMEAETLTLKRMTPGEIAFRESQSLPPMPSPSFPTGAKMEMFSAKDITGKKVNPKELAGKIIVLNFWFIACPPCKDEIPALNKITNKYAGNDNVVFIAVCLDQRSEINDYLKQTLFNYRHVADGRFISEGFSVKSYPTNVLIDRQGIIRFSSMGYGPGTVKWLGKAIDEIYSEN